MKFQCKYKSFFLKGDIFTNHVLKGHLPNVVLLHGGGLNTSRTRFESLRKQLLNYNISTCAFDFLGHGDTCGVLSSLKDRTEQSLCIINNYTRKPVTIIASSMSGYNAIKLLDYGVADKLVLFVPAVYTTEAYNVPFGEQFSRIIREDNSWINTDAWDILNGFKGKILLITAGKDTVVKKEITQKIYDSASNASYREYLEIAESSHKIFDFIYKDYNLLHKITNSIINLNST